MENLPSGPIPADFEESVAALIRDVGVTILTKKVLRKRLEAKYNIEFSSHDAALTETLKNLLRTPEFSRELAKAKEAEAVGGKGKKRARAEEKEPKREKKEKKPDDYPKAALSAYILFGNDNREKIKAEKPDAKVTEILKLLGEAWAKCSQGTKDRYSEMAAADKTRFENEMKAYLARGGKVVKRGGKKDKKGKKAKDPNAPKRPMSAFMYFTSEYRTKHTGVSVTEQMKNAGAEWKTLNDEAKKPFETLAAKDKERYIRECAAKGIKTTATSAANAAPSSDSSSSDSESD